VWFKLLCLLCDDVFYVVICFLFVLARDIKTTLMIKICMPTYKPSSVSLIYFLFVLARGIDQYHSDDQNLHVYENNHPQLHHCTKLWNFVLL